MSTEATDQASAQPMPTFSVSRYQSDGGFTLAGAMMLLSSLLVVGAILGYVAYWVSQLIWLILIFPGAIGLAMGAVGARMITQGRVRAVWLAGIAGLLGGFLAMFMTHYFTYRHAVAAIDAPQVVKDQVRFIDFMDAVAEEGVSINKAGSSSKGMNLGYVGSWIYWGVEVLIVAGITLAMCVGAAGQPYCRQCDEWKKPKLLGSIMGSADKAAAAILAGDLSGLKENAPSAQPGGPMLLTIATCPSHPEACPADVKLETYTKNAKGEESRKTIAHVTYPAEAVAWFEYLFATAAPAADPSTENQPPSQPS